MSYSTGISGGVNNRVAGNVADDQITLKGGFLYRIYVSGTFAGATVTPKFRDQVADVWCTAGDGITAAKTLNLEAASGTELDFDITGGDGTTSINVNWELVRNH